jgi:serine/threonine protein kinase
MFKAYHKAEVIFEPIEEIGADGKNSKTSLVYDHQLRATIVAKQIAKAKLASHENFFDESSALYAGAHPNVVQIHYACYDDDYIYIAMPYYKKGSLKRLITGQHMTVREIIIAGCQVLSGLHNIHSKGLIHFDVKPDNILLSDRGEALLSDFGLAKQMKYGMAHQDRLYGKMTPPEGLDQDKFDITFDIYQFGVTLYRMCNGNESFYTQFLKYGIGPAFDRDRFRFDVRNARFPDRKTFSPHIPAKLRKIIRKCTDTDRANRYRSAIDVANALADIEGNTLDWRLVETPDTRVWTKNESGTLYELRVTAAGASECYKTTEGGQARRVKEGCKAFFDEKGLQKFLGGYG